MKRVLFDTSVYGELILDPALAEQIRILDDKGEMVVYSVKVIRKELRDTAAQRVFQKKKLRIMLLELHDSLVKDRQFETNEIVEIVARKYFETYKRIGGSFSQRELFNDYCIVACATLQKLNIVISHDSRTMLSPHSLQAYKTVNEQLQLENPEFLQLNSFKQQLQRLSKSGDERLRL